MHQLTASLWATDASASFYICKWTPTLSPIPCNTWQLHCLSDWCICTTPYAYMNTHSNWTLSYQVQQTCPNQTVSYHVQQTNLLKPDVIMCSEQTCSNQMLSCAANKLAQTRCYHVQQTNLLKPDVIMGSEQTCSNQMLSSATNLLKPDVKLCATNSLKPDVIMCNNQPC